MSIDPGEWVRQHGPAEAVDQFRGGSHKTEECFLLVRGPPHPRSRCSWPGSPAQIFSHSVSFVRSSSTISSITSALHINLGWPAHPTPHTKGPSTPQALPPVANAKSSPVDFWIGSPPPVSSVALQYLAQVTYSWPGRSLLRSLIHSMNDQTTN